MKLNSVQSLFSDAFKGFVRNIRLNLFSSLSIGFSLFTLSLILAIVLNVTSIVDGYKENFDLVEVFLQGDPSSDQIDDLVEKLQENGLIREVTYISSEEGFKELKESWGENAYLLDGFEEAIPDSIKIRVKDIENVTQVIEELKQLSLIDDINYSEDVISNLINITRILNRFGLVLILMIIFITIVLTTSTIRINIHSRQKEINIMKHVGATNWYVRFPYMIEGALLGFTGCLISTGIIYFGYKMFEVKISKALFGNLLPNLLTTSEVVYKIFGVTLVVGVGVGIIGSLISIRKYLKV